MKISKVAAIAALALVFGLVAFSQNSFAQEEEATFEGALVAVDAELQTITLEDAENMQMTFSYSSETEILGYETTIQGLSNQDRASLQVVYMNSDNPVAKRILVLEQ